MSWLKAHRRIAVCLLVSGLSCFTPMQASACSCISITPKRVSQAAAEAKAVFIGKVTRIETLEPYAKQLGTYTAIYTTKRIHFALSSAWKGVNTPETVIETTWGPFTCEGYPFEEGKQYLVVTNRDELRVDSACSPTQLISSPVTETARSLMAVLGNPVAEFAE